LPLGIWSFLTVVESAPDLVLAKMPIEINEMYDFWLVASNLNQSLATVFGILGNALLLYMIRFVSLGEMKVLIPLLRVHSVVGKNSLLKLLFGIKTLSNKIIGILQTLLNASAYARIFIIHGQFFVVLTGSFITEDPWRSILLTSVVWVALFEVTNGV
jgi:drug/metabolite transporter superfamily protein YnfA